MPNVKLTKDDGLILVLPPATITAVFTTEKQREKPSKNPKARSVIFSTYRGFSVFFLKMTAKEAFEAITAKDDSSREWIEMPVGEDASYIQPRISALEGVELADESPGIRVWIQRPDGNEGFTDVDHNDELFAMLCDRVGVDDDVEPVRRKTKVLRPAARPRPAKKETT